MNHETSVIAEDPGQYLFDFYETKTTSTSAILQDAMHASHRVGEIGELDFDMWAISNNLNAWKSINTHTRIDRILVMPDGTYRGFHIKTSSFSTGKNRYTFKSGSEMPSAVTDYWYLVGLNQYMEVNFRLIIPFMKFGSDCGIWISSSKLLDYSEYMNVPKEFSDMTCRTEPPSDAFGLHERKGTQNETTQTNGELHQQRSQGGRT